MHAILAIVACLWLSLQVQAQSALPQCDGPSITISSLADAESISSCDVYEGDVIIDPFTPGPVVLDGLRIIKGNLTAINATNFDNVSSNSLEAVRGSLHVSGNFLHGVGPLNLYLPKLESAGNITISHVLNIQTSSLTTVAGAMGIYSSSIQRFTFPSLSSSGDFIELVDCSFYTNPETPNTLTIGALTDVGGDLIVSNGVFYYALNFPQLEVVSGSIQFLGDLQNITMPSLTKVGSNARIQTDSLSHDVICDEIHRLVKDNIIEGHDKCSVSPEYTSSGPPNGLIAGLVVGVVGALALAFAALYHFCLRPKRRSQPPSEGNPHIRHGEPQETELPLYSEHDELKR